VEDNTKMFGPHLMLDLYGCKKKRLVDLDLIYNALDELPGLLNMHKIMPPYVIPYKGSADPHSFDRGGISGVVIIAESHIGIHTFVEQKFASIDIFSCKNFEPKFAVEYFDKLFEPESYDKNFVMRGREFPREIMRVRHLVKKDRTKF